jgi:DNA polymerase (family 10)
MDTAPTEDSPQNKNERFFSNGPSEALSNAEIADRLASLAQLMAAGKENPYKVKAYQRAAARIRTFSESIDELVHEDADLTAFPGIGDAIAATIREIVTTGTLGRLETLRAGASPQLAGISQYPRLDPKRVLRIYKKLGIELIEDLKERLEAGEVEKVFGLRMAQHIRQGLTETHAMLLYRADDLRASIEEFLLSRCGVRSAEVAGDYRRRVEVIEEISFVVQTDDFTRTVENFHRFGGRTPLVTSDDLEALFAVSAGVLVRLSWATEKEWGLALIACTGSKTHLRKLSAVTGPLKAWRASGPWPSEAAFYEHFGLAFIEPELREGHDEVDLAASGTLPALVSAGDIRGELHAHSTSSDGAHSIEQMAAAAQQRGYEYIGITDHSQSLKIAGGVSIADLWKQIRFIDKLNGHLPGIRVLKSAEVDILANGSLDYPDDVLRELDYTVCSIHSRFGLNREQQTLRVMRAMENRYFNILGHATGRLLLKRPGYELDMERVIDHAGKLRCFFEINSSPDRLDLSAENARAAMLGGANIAISTDAHSIRDFGLVRYGLDQARRAGLTGSDILNSMPWSELCHLMKR